MRKSPYEKLSTDQKMDRLNKKIKEMYDILFEQDVQIRIQEIATSKEGFKEVNEGYADLAKAVAKIKSISPNPSYY